MKRHLKNANFYIVISLVLHLIVYLGTRFSPIHESVPNLDTIEFEIKTSGTVVTEAFEKVKKIKAQKSNSSSQLKVKDLLPQISTASMQQNASNNDYKSDVEARIGDLTSDGKFDGYDVAASINPLSNPEHHLFFAELLKQVNFYLDYPDVLTKSRVTGKVEVHLEVDYKGIFTGNLLRTIGNSDYLNAYTTATLIHALKKPLKEKNWNKEPTTIVVFDVKYDVYRPGEATPKETAEYFKNMLSYTRYGLVNNKLNESYEQISKYLPPIIPIPGGFMVDVVGAFKLIKGHVEPESDKIKLRKMDLEEQKLRWDSTIQKSL